MPENAKVAAYAAAGSLLAATLAYVFSPSIWPDVATGSGRRKGVVGIRNPGNDCFINSVLQVLAASETLRHFLATEVEARAARGVPPNTAIIESATLSDKGSKATSLRGGLVTTSLKDVLETLSERHAFQRNISNITFIRSLEVAFGTRISRRQQDAQEFFQIVAERILEEHVALIKLQASGQGIKQANKSLEAKASSKEISSAETVNGTSPDPLEHEAEDDSSDSDSSESSSSDDETRKEPADDGAVPFEGKLESQVECQTCHFKPRPSVSTFVCLTLNVPQRKATTLDDCLDGLLKQEVIDDYICDRCRLEHAIAVTERSMSSTTSPEKHQELEERRKLLQNTLENDPEKVPSGLTLPDSKQAPKRKITKHTRISHFPKVLAIHLSRSIFDPGSYSMKNLANVAFPEHLRLGGFDRHDYKLAGLITHIGGHNSGHYETFRRQAEAAPQSATAADEDKVEAQPPPQKKKKNKPNKRWWRISDDRIGSCHPSDVFGMKREAYILLYELEEQVAPPLSSTDQAPLDEK